MPFLFCLKSQRCPHFHSNKAFAINCPREISLLKPVQFRKKKSGGENFARFLSSTITYPDGDIKSKRRYAALQRLFFRLSQTWNSAAVPATQLHHNQQCNRIIFPFKMQIIGPRLHKTKRGITKTAGKPPGDCLVII
jgi:hypothetical protein